MNNNEYSTNTRIERNQIKYSKMKAFERGVILLVFVSELVSVANFEINGPKFLPLALTEVYANAEISNDVFIQENGVATPNEINVDEPEVDVNIDSLPQQENMDTVKLNVSNGMPFIPFSKELDTKSTDEEFIVYTNPLDLSQIDNLYGDQLIKYSEYVEMLNEDIINAVGEKIDHYAQIYDIDPVKTEFAIIELTNNYKNLNKLNVFNDEVVNTKSFEKFLIILTNDIATNPLKYGFDDNIYCDFEYGDNVTDVKLEIEYYSKVFNIDSSFLLALHDYSSNLTEDDSIYWLNTNEFDNDNKCREIISGPLYLYTNYGDILNDNELNMEEKINFILTSNHKTFNTEALIRNSDIIDFIDFNLYNYDDNDNNMIKGDLSQLFIDANANNYSSDKFATAFLNVFDNHNVLTGSELLDNIMPFLNSDQNTKYNEEAIKIVTTLYNDKNNLKTLKDSAFKKNNKKKRK